MARDNTADEARTRREMTDACKRQKNGADGFDDWGRFTAYVVCAQRQELERLRALLHEHSIDSGSWDDPFEVQSQMADVLIYWRDLRRNHTKACDCDGALYWHSNARWFEDLTAGDRLWLVAAGKNLANEQREAPQAARHPVSSSRFSAKISRTRSSCGGCRNGTKRSSAPGKRSSLPLPRRR